MSPLVVAGVAVVCATTAASLTPWARRLVRTDSRWLRVRVPAFVAGVAGAGAAVIAETWAETLAFATLAVVAGLLVPLDLATYRLPDAIVGPAYPLLLGPLAAAAASGGDWGRLLGALLGGLAVLAGYLVLALIAPVSLGLGDVKLSGLLGSFLGWFGWHAVLLGTLAAFAAFAALALALLASRRVSLRTDLPFGPAMVIGAAAGAGWTTAL